MSEKSLAPVIGKLEKLFSSLNSRFFNGELQQPVITVSPDSTKGAYGWCTSWKAWTDKEPKPFNEMTPEEVEALKADGYFEINICAEHIARPFPEVVETLLHEMIHLFNLYKGVQDTSRSGTYHNKNFKVAAEAHGLTVTQTPKYGYSETALNDEAKAFVQSLGHTKFELYRKPVLKKGGTAKAKQSSRKYVCPGCGAIIRATKEVHVICGDCDVAFKEDE